MKGWGWVGSTHVEASPPAGRHDPHPLPVERAGRLAEQPPEEAEELRPLQHAADLRRVGHGLQVSYARARGAGAQRRTGQGALLGRGVGRELHPLRLQVLGEMPQAGRQLGDGQPAVGQQGDSGKAGYWRTVGVGRAHRPRSSKKPSSCSRSSAPSRSPPRQSGAESVIHPTPLASASAPGSSAASGSSPTPRRTDRRPPVGMAWVARARRCRWPSCGRQRSPGG